MVTKIDLSAIIKISIAAGKAIMNIYEKDFEVEQKDDQSPLTEADKASNDIIVSRLKEHYPDIPIISEETRQTEYEQRKDWSFCWLVDPLDGTKEFIKRNGEFTVNIALIRDQKPVLGVIYVPAKDELYFCSGEVRSHKLEHADATISDGMDLEGIKALSTALPLPNGNDRNYTVVGSRSHMSPETEEFIEQLKEQHGEIDILSRGSSLKICMVAEGKADVYPRFAPTMEWDTGAGQAIAEQSGSVVIDNTTQQPLRYNKENLLNNWFIVQRG